MRNPFNDIRSLMSQAAAIGRDRTATIRGPVLWLALCGGLLVAAIFIGTTMMVGEFRERALANNERELENQASLRSAVRGFRKNRHRCDLRAADFCHRFAGDVQRTDVESASA
jgi:hypothetical protein